MSTETWRPVDGFPYQVSDQGRVRRTGSSKCLRQYRCIKRNGGVYLRVDLSRWNRRHYRFVHRLVAAAFLAPPRPDQREVNHIDCDTLNNAADNLEWCNRSENEAHKRFWLGAERRAPVTQEAS